jgi:hypothetical protein
MMQENNHQPRFPSRAKEEMFYARQQLIKGITILVVLAIVLYIAHFFNAILTLLLAFIGFLLLLATFTYAIGHFVRFLIFSRRGE